jgi:hypothetical protein
MLVSRQALKTLGVTLVLVGAGVMLQRLRSGPEGVSISVGDQTVFKMTKCKPGQN